VIKNVRLESSLSDEQFSRAKNLGEKAGEKLGEKYRVLIRQSGTEPLIRIMVEGEDLSKVTQASTELETGVRSILS
jgi:phosphoglucosamine mutase